MNDPSVAIDRRAERRAARRAESQTEILDAAEKVFGAHGLRDGSLREIAEESGFSTAAIYLFFDNKQHLVVETLSRRGDELIAAVAREAEGDVDPLEKLHRIVDATAGFFAERPNFRRMLRHIRGGASITGPILAEFGGGASTRFDEVMGVLANVVRDGQDVGEIRDGDARALAHLYSVLINEFVLLTSSDDTNVRTLTSAQFHALIDGALRKDEQTASRRVSGPTLGAG
jgi:AcrR family transcriptional regulator